MSDGRYSEEAIAAALTDGDRGVPLDALLHTHGISRATYFRWKVMYHGADPDAIRRLRELDRATARLARLRIATAVTSATIREALKDRGRRGREQ